jgi:hypothetical protein
MAGRAGLAPAPFELPGRVKSTCPVTALTRTWERVCRLGPLFSPVGWGQHRHGILKLFIKCENTRSPLGVMARCSESETLKMNTLFWPNT